jgi:hypothetical protein
MRHETGRAGQATGMAAAGAFDGPIGIAGPGNAGSLSWSVWLWVRAVPV